MEYFKSRIYLERAITVKFEIKLKHNCANRDIPKISFRVIYNSPRYVYLSAKICRTLHNETENINKQKITKSEKVHLMIESIKLCGCQTNKFVI